MVSNTCPPGMSFGAWLKEKNLHYGAVGTKRKSYQRWDASLDAYEDAIRQGVEPDSTQLEDVQRAVRSSDRTGVAYGS